MALPKFEQVEHTADIALRIYGETLEELFVHAAEALFEVLGTYRWEEETVRHAVALEAPGREDLLHDWLAQLNYLHQTRREVYNRFDVRLADGHRLEAVVAGEAIAPTRHNIELEVKAVTYHQLSVEQTEQGWQAFVIFDI